MDSRNQETGNEEVKERVNSLCNKCLVLHRTLRSTMAEKKKSQYTWENKKKKL